MGDEELQIDQRAELLLVCQSQEGAAHHNLSRLPGTRPLLLQYPTKGENWKFNQQEQLKIEGKK